MVQGHSLCMYSMFASSSVSLRLIWRMNKSEGWLYFSLCVSHLDSAFLPPACFVHVDSTLDAFIFMSFFRMWSYRIQFWKSTGIWGIWMRVILINWQNQSCRRMQFSRAYFCSLMRMQFTTLIENCKLQKYSWFAQKYWHLHSKHIGITIVKLIWIET